MREYFLNTNTKLKLVLQGDGTYAIGVSTHSPPGGGVDTYIYLNTDTKLKLVDLGDGTFAIATAGTGSATPSGPAGGDLAGSFPNPSVRHVTAGDKTISYNGDGTINVITDPYGTKTFAYNGDGTIASITGTGVYQTKTFVYDGSNRIEQINV